MAITQGLAKEIPQVTQSSPEQSQAQLSGLPSPSQSWDGIAMDVYKYFNCDFFDASDKHKSEMRDIYEYAKGRSNGMTGDIIQKIEELEHRLGTPQIGETRLGKMSNYIRVLRNISDMNKQRRALERGYRSF